MKSSDSGNSDELEDSVSSVKYSIMIQFSFDREKAKDLLHKIHIIYKLEIRHITKFSDTFIVDCGNCRKAVVEVYTANCELHTTIYSLHHKCLIMKQSLPTMLQHYWHYFDPINLPINVLIYLWKLH